MTANTAYAISAALTPPKSPTARLKAAGEATEATASDGSTRTVLAQVRAKTKAKAKAKAKVAKVEVEESRVDAYLTHLQQVIPHQGTSKNRT